MIVAGLSWARIDRGIFATQRFKSGHSGYVAGTRGAWHWQVDRREPPKFHPVVIVAEGDAPTKIAAMVATKEAIAKAERGECLPGAHGAMEVEQ